MVHVQQHGPGVALFRCTPALFHHILVRIKHLEHHTMISKNIMTIVATIESEAPVKVASVKSLQAGPTHADYVRFPSTQELNTV